MNHIAANGLTQLMHDMATSRYLTLHEAVNELKENAHVRTIRDTLERFSGLQHPDKAQLQAYLVDALMKISPADTKKASVERKVRMWLSDDVQSISKKSAIQLCFALNLSLEDANLFLARSCEEGFHWRDPQEIIYIYALMHGLDYLEAEALGAHMDEKGLLRKRRVEKEAKVYTNQVRDGVSRLNSEMELEDFLRETQNELGSLHNTAYSLFVDFMDLLSAGEEDEDARVRDLSVRRILEIYLHKEFVPRAQNKSKDNPDSEKLVLSAMQRNIRQNWPDEMTLSRMLHREVDVSRKVLILLFLATDGGDSDYADDIIGEQLPEDVFQDMYERMNGMLMDCGFAPLDSRVPFDWMVLYCMCADESIFIDGRIQQFLTRVFPETGAEVDFADQ